MSNKSAVKMSVSTSEVDTVDQIAEGEAMEAVAAENMTGTGYDPETGEVADAGLRARSAFAMKHFLPDADYIAREVTAKGKGTHVIIGRIFGTIVKSEPKLHQHGQEMLHSIALIGMLQSESALGLPSSSFSIVYLPNAFARQIDAALSMERDAGNQSPAIVLDVDIGVQATGKAIPYEWTVISYREGRAEKALRSIRESRRIGQPANPQSLRLA